ncbi:MAG: tyrosine--tRNA ligase [Chlamydiales bacterium]|nr:tyrosine--tRNA ligase [Chlamydiales bacterium]
MSELIQLLSDRGLIDTISHEELHAALKKHIKVYCGFDPTASSLHLGNLVGLIVLKWFHDFGHTPVVLLGGATARIGDPSGKSKERPLLSDEEIRKNSVSIELICRRFFDFSSKQNRAILVDNYDWLSKFTLIEFLRDVGKQFRLSTMLAKESVKTRLESEEGMSFTEFTYQMLQGYDFFHLMEHWGVCLQIGGSDQWGNITAGIEYVRKTTQKTAYGLTFPLLTRSDGKKFGKSEQGAIWLDNNMCSYYQFYQYFIGVPDLDVIKMLKTLTFLSLEEIKEIERTMVSPSYSPNTAQKILAAEVTRFVHGDEGLAIAMKVTSAASPGSEMDLNIDIIEQIKADFPLAALSKEDVLNQQYVHVIAKSGLVPSKSEANRLIANQGAYLNNKKVTDVKKIIQQDDLIGEKYLVVGSGKKKKLLIQIEN